MEQEHLVQEEHVEGEEQGHLVLEEPVAKRARSVVATETEGLWEDLPRVWGRSATSCSEVGSRSKSRRRRQEERSSN